MSSALTAARLVWGYVAGLAAITLAGHAAEAAGQRGSGWTFGTV